MNQQSANDGQLYWLMSNESPIGPFDTAQIHEKLTAGDITWQTLACALGKSSWLPLVQTPGIGPNAVIDLPPPPPVVQRSPMVETPSPAADIRMRPASAPKADPWSPTTIAWLGIVFSPVWAGVMAAINGKRLRSPKPIWVPLAIGIGSCALDLFVTDFLLLDVLLYGGALAALWWFVLKPQQALLSENGSQSTTGAWLWPSVAGAPLAVIVFLALVVAPLLPLEPRQVCERFIAATSAQEAAKYTTVKLLPILQAMHSSKDDDGDAHFELTDEFATEDGDYFVGCQMVATTPTEFSRMSGAFHVVHWCDEWKIDDLYIVEVNGQKLEEWKALSAMPLDTFQQNQPANQSLTQRLNNPPTTPAGQAGKKEWYQSPAAGKAVGKGAGAIAKSVGNSKGGKALYAVLAVIAMGIFSWLKQIFSSGNPTANRNSRTTDTNNSTKQ